MASSYEGGCQCGAIRYRITTDEVALFACHCSHCQRQSGSAFGLSMRLPAENFQVTEGEPRHFERLGHGQTIRCYFCADCGTRIHHVLGKRPDLVSVKPGTLDDTDWLPSPVHVYVDTAQPWITFPADAEVHATTALGDAGREAVDGQGPVGRPTERAPTAAHEGGCQCGAIRYRITGEPDTVYACHCQHCQRQSGSAFAMAMRVPDEHFELTRGRLKRFDRPGNGQMIAGYFCPDCGTRIYHVPQRSVGQVSVKPGTLDDTSWLRPSVHFFGYLSP